MPVSICGIKSLLTSAANVMLSVSLLPSVILPSNVMLPTACNDPSIFTDELTMVLPVGLMFISELAVPVSALFKNAN